MVSSSDASFHSVNDFSGGPGGLGEYRIELHPIGTTLCPTCRLVYASEFEMCPRLIEIAIEKLSTSTDPSQSTDLQYIREVIINSPIAAAGFVETMLTKYDRGKCAKAYLMKAQDVLKSLGFSKLASTIRRYRYN